MSDSEALSRLYRQLPPEEPTTALDAQVLAAVNAELAAAREQRARWQRRWRYQIPLATAATLVLAVALLLRQPGTETGLIAPHSGAGILADSNSPMDYERQAAAEHSTLPPPLMSPPPPVPVPAPVPPPAIVALLDMPAPASMPTAPPELAAPPAAASAPPAVALRVPDMAATAPVGIVADKALPQATLATLLLEAEGMPATVFCTRLQALWPSDATAPACPTSDGQHEWPAPLGIVWEVNAGRVVRAEKKR